MMAHPPGLPRWLHFGPGRPHSYMEGAGPGAMITALPAGAAA